MKPFITIENFISQTTLLPTNVWGTQFPLIPFASITNQQYQIVANTNGTIINADGRQYQLNAGGYLLINVSGISMLTSNYPIQMIQMGQVNECRYVFQSFIYKIMNRIPRKP